jgi:hypothetical protein
MVSLIAVRKVLNLFLIFPRPDNIIELTIDKFQADSGV